MAAQGPGGLVWCPLADVAEQAAAMQAVAELIHAAGPFYFQALWGEREHALQQLAHRLADERSGFTFRHVDLVLHGAQVAGMRLAMSGAQLAQGQRNDLMALLRQTDGAARQSLADKLNVLRAIAPRLVADDYYLRALAVAPAYRGQGLGARLLEGFVTAGRTAGFRHLRLDVHADNARAIALYRHLGFQVDTTSGDPAHGWRVWSMVLPGVAP